MSETIILHHYENSPYAEKVRLMFGLSNAPWQSLLSPAYPPRPNLDPLTGGYRRIPVAQIGADIFCDSSLIAQEVSRVTHCPALDPSTIEGNALSLMKQAEEEAFFAAIAAVPPLRLLGTMLKSFGPFGMYQFIKDRSGFLKGGTRKPPESEQAKAVLRSLLDALEERLSGHQWLAGDHPSVADLACYHPLWLHVNCSRRPLAAGPNVQRWYQQVAEIGHGQRKEISREEAFEAARTSEPRPQQADNGGGPLEAGSLVQVAPSDYGVVPVTGTLVSVTESRIVIARDTEEFGKLHVHFPYAGYSLKAV